MKRFCFNLKKIPLKYTNKQFVEKEKEISVYLFFFVFNKKVRIFILSMMNFSILPINYFNYLIPYIKIKFYWIKMTFIYINYEKLHFTPLNYTTFYTYTPKLWECTLYSLNYYPSNTCPLIYYSCNTLHPIPWVIV